MHKAVLTAVPTHDVQECVMTMGMLCVLSLGLQQAQRLTRRVCRGTEADGVEGQVFYKLFEYVVIDLLQDPSFKDAIDYAAKPLFNQDGERLFGPMTSGAAWEDITIQHPGKTPILVVFYSDATTFYKNTSAHPVFSTCTAVCSSALLEIVLCVVFV